MNTVQPMYKWQEIPWRKLERKVFKLQKRIFQAASRGDRKTVRKLQKLLLNSWSAKCLAVRRVTQDNRGKKTAGVDGQKALSPEARLKLVGRLKLTGKSQPTRRVWIPKPGKDEKRPLGIPTIEERAKQTLAKLALEPEWEAQFEASSYGFRPGRSTHDAIKHIFTSITKKDKYVLDADISKCFDRINHERLLEKVNTFPTLRRQIRAWLKAGVMDGKTLFPTEEGTPQGGSISPLLANIALHGMIDALKDWAANPPKEIKKEFPSKTRDRINSLTVVRYADDFVILNKSRVVIEEARKVVEKWLEPMGLELRPEKTRITHTLKEENKVKPGFNFLGFHVRHFEVSKYKSGKSQKGYVARVEPTKEAILRHYRAIADKISQLISAPQAKLIAELNPIIRGWGNYYRTEASSKAFSFLDHLIFKKLWAWAKRRHHNKNLGWIKDKYWHTVGGNNWTFGVKLRNGDFISLQKHTQIGIQRHTKVKDTASPYDGNLTYWSTRLGRNPLIGKRTSMLLKQQKGKCPECGLQFKDGDLMETDHILPRSLGGKDVIGNLQVLHQHCHDKKTSNDGSLSGVYDKHQSVEEPCAGKLASTVLKTSRNGDVPA